MNKSSEIPHSLKHVKFPDNICFILYVKYLFNIFEALFIE
jgi:hypothetical protein